MDIEVTMEDLATMAEEPETTQDPAMAEDTRKEVMGAFSRTLRSFRIARDNTT